MTISLNDKSPIKGKTWGRCSKKELLNIIEFLNIERNNLIYAIHQRNLLHPCYEANNQK